MNLPAYQQRHFAAQDAGHFDPYHTMSKKHSDKPVEVKEGQICPECKSGTMEYPPVKNCACHINPPCSACVNNRLKCDECGFGEAKQEPAPPPSPQQIDAWAKQRDEWEAARQRGHILPSGGRIFDISRDGSSGSTMEFRGRYEGPVTAREIFEHLGDGTFGHRGPSLFGNRFTYTKITD